MARDREISISPCRQIQPERTATGTLTIAGQTIPLTQRATVATFADVTPSAFYFDYPNLMLTLGITNGCSTVPLAFCPNDTITRGQNG